MIPLDHGDLGALHSASLPAKAPVTPLGPSFHVESFAAIMDELRPLFYQHWREVALEQNRIKLDPDWLTYCKMEQAGVLAVQGVRDGARLTGYYFSQIIHNLHYRASKQAYQDIYYLSPEVRGCFPAFLRFVEEDLKSRGVQKTYIMRKLHTSKAAAHDRMIRSMGYRPIELWYSKMLED